MCLLYISLALSEIYLCSWVSVDGSFITQDQKRQIYFDIFSHSFVQGLHNLYIVTILLELNAFVKLHLWAIIIVFLTIFGHAAINSVFLPFFNNYIH